MPKPFIFQRPSGLFCRFLVPVGLRGHMGCRFLVRALFTVDQDRARLLASILAVSLAQLFRRVRRGENLDVKKLLQSGQFEGLRQLMIGKVTTQTGETFENVKIDNDDDQRRFEALLHSGSFKPQLPDPIRRSDEDHLLEDKIASFLAVKAKGDLSEKNLAEAEFALRRLVLPLCGNKPVSLIGSHDADKVMNALLEWPSNASKKQTFKALTAAEIIVKARLVNARMIAPRTVEKYLDRIRVFFTWCIDLGYINGPNPFANRRLMTKDKRSTQQKRPFSSSDLERIFDPKLRMNCDQPHKFWCPLVALFSGARLNEIAQLYTSDIIQSGNVWLFKITADMPHQKIKNKASERVVPIHSELISLGFLDYVNDVKNLGFDRLFPNLPVSSINGFGDAVGDWFNARYLRPAALGSKAPRAGISDPKKSFHSFRHVVINRLYTATKDTKVVAEITGHERGNDVLTNIYITPSEAAERAATLNLVEYPNLTFQPYVSGAFDGFFRRLKRKIVKA